MTTSEFSNEFDVLYNNITSNQAPGLNEYEKSVFLTKAQNQLINEYFNQRTDGVGGGFDGSQKRQYDFSKLIRVSNLNPLTGTDYSNYNRVDKRSAVYIFPKDYYLAVNEILSDGDYQYNVIPIDYAEYSRLMMKPYNFPVKRAVWRLFTSKVDITENTVIYKVPVAELIGKPVLDTTSSSAVGLDSSGLSTNNILYTLRYIKKPVPIILENLTNYGGSISIDGVNTVSDCELPEETHKEILERAVTLAKIAWQGGTMTQAAAQQRNND